MIQLDFLQPLTELEICHEQIKQVKVSSDKVRKKLFAENNKLWKEFIEIKDRLDILERHICKSNFGVEVKKSADITSLF